MKRMIFLFLSVGVTLGVYNIAWATETVGAPNWIYIGPCDFDFSVVATQALTYLGNVGFVAKKPSYSKTTIGASNVLEIKDMGNYGGILIWVGHGREYGGYGWIVVETFPDTPAGEISAGNRKNGSCRARVVHEFGTWRHRD